MNLRLPLPVTYLPALPSTNGHYLRTDAEALFARHEYLISPLPTTLSGLSVSRPGSHLKPGLLQLPYEK